MKRLAPPIVLISLMLSLVGVALARPGTAKSESTTVETSTEVENQARAAHLKATQADRLDEIKQKRCAVATKVINQKTANRIRQAENQLRVFNDIAGRIQDFAKRRDITISNLDTLLADLDTKKAKVTADLDQLKADAAAFKCDGTNPKATVEAFNADSKLIRTDLKAYRQAVHAIKTAAQAALKAKTTSQEGTP